MINFDFDAEWDDYDVKTARFVHDGSYIDVVFTGNQCVMPVINKAYGIYVGVYAGDLRTTTPAHIPSAASILSADGTPEEPPDDVYAQITALCNEAVSEVKSVRGDADAGKFNGAPGKTPVVGEDYFTEEDKQEIASEAAKAVGFPRPKVSDNGMYLGCENGEATWMPVDASGGGGGNQWHTVRDITISEEVNKIVIGEDEDGIEIEKYRPIAICASLDVPSDETQPIASGYVWAYPSTSIMNNEIRVILAVPTWKTSRRILTIMFMGNDHAMVAVGSVNQSINTFLYSDYSLDGVSLYINNPDTNGHLPVGTRINVAVLGVKP